MVDTMNTTNHDLDPWDIVWHREFGPGIIYISTLDDKMCVMHRNVWGRISASPNLTGWERIEIVKPGHVQVRVDDLDDCPSEWLREDEDTWNFAPRVAIRVANALAAQRAQNKPAQPDAYDKAADYLDAVNDNREHDPAIRDLRSQAQCLREDAARAHLRRP